MKSIYLKHILAKLPATLAGFCRSRTFILTPIYAGWVGAQEEIKLGGDHDHIFIHF